MYFSVIVHISGHDDIYIHPMIEQFVWQPSVRPTLESIHRAHLHGHLRVVGQAPLDQLHLGFCPKVVGVDDGESWLWGVYQPIMVNDGN